MEEIYIVESDGLTVDLICWWYYGRTDGTTEKVFDVNPELSLFGPILPLGLTIKLPEISRQTTKSVVRLWN